MEEPTTAAPSLSSPALPPPLNIEAVAMSLRLTRRLVPLTLATATAAAFGGLSLASAEAATQPEATPTALPAHALPHVYPSPNGGDEGSTTHKPYVGHGHVYAVNCYHGPCGASPGFF
ncbi:hypothetical protein AB0D29_32945 [Streptomyces sp. NPDC048424]|uniref:hypothetical protein n=1 Tax=Streptomyces sp. NPDC048424 TaxID=3155265 RepID=UPI00341E9D98